MALLKVEVVEWQLAFHELLEGDVVLLEGVVEGLDTLVLADVRPGVLNVRHHPLIEGSHIALGQVVYHLARELLAVECLGPDAVDDLAAKRHHLLYKLGSQLLQLRVLKVLQLFLLCERTHHRAAVPLREERLQQFPHPVLLFDAL